MTAPTLSTRALVALLRTSPHSLCPALDPAAPAVAIVALGGDALDGDLATPASIGTVLVGVGDATDPGAALCDVVLSEGDPLTDAVVATVGQHPIAASALVTLLRGSEGRTISDGLLLESAVYSALQAGPEHRAWRAATPTRPIPDPTGPLVLVARDGATLVLTLQRPDRHNAFSRAMRDALLDALDVAVLDPAIQVVLRGAGASFCSGGDLDEFGSAGDPAVAHLVRIEASVGRVVSDMAERVTVHLHGACMGAGIELPAFAGRVTASPDARLSLPELRLGLIPGAGGTAGLPRRIGRQRTALLALSGEPIDAATALAWGLVDELTAEPIDDGHGNGARMPG